MSACIADRTSRGAMALVRAQGLLVETKYNTALIQQLEKQSETCDRM